MNQTNWGEWVLMDVPPDVPLVYLLNRGSNGGLYRVRVSRRVTEGKLNMMISPADLMYSGSDYPHVIIRVDAFNKSTSFEYYDYHYSPSADGKRFGKREVKRIQEVRPILAKLLPTFLRKDPTMAISIAKSLGCNFVTGKRGIF